MGAPGARGPCRVGIAVLVAAVAALCMGLGAGPAFAQSTAAFHQPLLRAIVLDAHDRPAAVPRCGGWLGITAFLPSSGPIEGGFTVTIHVQGLRVFYGLPLAERIGLSFLCSLVEPWLMANRV